MTNWFDIIRSILLVAFGLLYLAEAMLYFAKSLLK